MQRLNPIDAIAPAFTRTHQVLFAPFRVGRSGKLALCFYIALGGSIFVPFPVFFSGLPWRSFLGGSSAFPIGAGIASAIFLLFFYLCVRMELTVFDVTLNRAKIIAPVWRKYGRRVWPWLGLKVLTGSLLTLAMAPPLVHAATRFFMVASSIPSFPRPVPGQPPDMSFLAPTIHQAVHLYAIVLLFLFLQKTLATLLYDFVLPFYLLESISLVSACARGLGVLAADPVNVVFYLMLKLVLAFIGYLLLGIVGVLLMIPVALIGAVAVALGLGVSLLQSASGPVQHLLIVGGAILFYGALYLLYVLLLAACVGYLVALLESYALYFLGGRYPLLGDLLEPPVAAPYLYTPPVLPPPDDDGSGPTTPMNPALA